jgi:hypothetical protein
MRAYSVTMSTILDKLKTLYEIACLPRVNFTFNKNLMIQENVLEVYHYFNKRHPRLKIIKNKQIGVAYIDLTKYPSGLKYLESVNGKNSAYYYARKCKARGYVLCEIDRNKYRHEIALIETSAPERQGRPMGEDYGEFEKIYVDFENYKYYGVTFNGRLVAYANIGIYGDFACVSRLMGHANHLNNGVMYLMLTEIVSNLIEQRNLFYIFYDTWYGASDGLRGFKRKLGFSPCMAHWQIGK